MRFSHLWHLLHHDDITFYSTVEGGWPHPSNNISKCLQSFDSSCHKSWRCCSCLSPRLVPAEKLCVKASQNDKWGKVEEPFYQSDRVHTSCTRWWISSMTMEEGFAWMTLFSSRFSSSLQSARLLSAPSTLFEWCAQAGSRVIIHSYERVRER